MSPEVLFTPAFIPEHWRQTRVPATVLAAQVAGGVYKDIFYADNLRKLPGMTAAVDGTKTSPYTTSWWYRTEFRLPQEFAGRKVWLHLNGINSKANVWLNGKRLANPRRSPTRFGCSNWM